MTEGKKRHGRTALVVAGLASMLLILVARSRREPESVRSAPAVPAARPTVSAEARSTLTTRQESPQAQAARQADLRRRLLLAGPLGPGNPAGRERRPEVRVKPDEPQAPEGTYESVLLSRLDVLKDADGNFGYNSREYAVTLGRGTVSFGSNEDLEEIGRPLLSYTLEEIRIGNAIVARGGDAEPQGNHEERSVTYRRGSVEERYLLRKDGMEQAFVIRELPEGRGAITVTGVVEGNLMPSGGGKPASRVSFAHQGVDRITVSEAVAKDAAGNTLPLELTCAGGKLSMTIPATWVAEAVLPIEIDPLYGAEITIDSTVTNFFWGYTAVETVYNSADATWLVVWNENVGSTNFGIYAQHVGSNGTLIGSAIQIDFQAASNHLLTDATVHYAASVNKYLVTWNGYDAALVYALRGKVLNHDGTTAVANFVVEDVPPVFSGDITVEQYSQIAFDGTNWFVAYAFYYQNPSAWYEYQVRGRFVSTSGVPGTSVILRQGIHSGNTQFLRVGTAVAYQNGIYLVAWKESNYDGVNPYWWGLYVQRMNTAGALLGGMVQIEPQTGVHGWTLSTRANQFFVCWSLGNLGANAVLKGGVWDTNFNPVVSPFTITNGTNSLMWVRSTYNALADDWFVVYQDFTTGDLYARHVSPTGVVSAQERITNSAVTDTAQSVAWNASTNHVLISYLYGSATPWQVRAKRFSLGSIPAPTGFAGTGQSTTSVQWSWTNVVGNYGYVVHGDVHDVIGQAATNATSFTETGLTENGLASRHLHTLTGGGESNPSTTATRYTLIHAPTTADITLTAASATQIDVVAAAPPNPTSGSTAVQIEYKANTSGTWIVAQAFSTTYTKSITGLLAATLYDVRVIYRNGNSVQTAYSPTKSLATLTAAPTGFGSSTQTTTSVTWTWTDVAGETSYALHDDDHVLRGSPAANATSIVESTLTENTRYSRHLHAVDGGGLSAASSTVAKYTRVHDPLAADFAVIPMSTTQIDVVAFLPPNFAVGSTACQIEYKLNTSGTWIVGQAWSTAYSKSITGLVASSLYDFRVIFRNGDAVATAYSPTKSAFTATPAVPTGLAGTGASTTSISWAFTGVANVSGYDLHDAAEAVKGNGAASPLVESGLLENTSYTRHVHALNGQLVGAGSTAASRYTLVHAPTAADFFVNATSSTGISITVTPPPNSTAGTTGCLIEYKANSSGTWLVAKAFSNVYTSTVGSLTAATLYDVRVTLRNGDSVSTAVSPTQSILTSTPPVPTGFAGAALTTTSIQWSWTIPANSGETTFVLHDASEVVKGSPAANATSFVEATGLTENAPFTRHVHATNGVGTSAASGSVTKSTLVHDPLDTNFTALVVTSTSVEITVTAPPNSTSGSTGVQIKRWDPATSTWTIIRAYSNVYTFTDTGFTGNARYCITFRNQDAVATADSPSKTALSTPTLIKPADGAATNDTTPDFDWTDVPGKAALTYELQVDDDPAFASPAINQTGLTVSNFTPGTALAQALYYVRVRAKYAGANLGPWSPVTTVRVDTGAPGAPTLVSPADTAQLNTTTPTLDWNPVTDTSGVVYHVQIDDVNTFASVNVDQGNIGASTWKVAPALTAGTWYWRVQTVDTAGNASGWSATRSFVVDLTAPSAPTLTAPGNNTTVSTTTPAFSWSSVAGTTYELQVDNEETFTAPYKLQKTGLATTSYTPTAGEALVGGVYLWRVIARDPAGNAGISAVFRFTVDTTSAPAAPRIDATSTRKTNDTTPTITGTCSELNTTIKIFFNGIQDGTTVSSPSNGNWSYTATAKTANQTYTVTARSNNANGDSPDSNLCVVLIDTICTPPTNLTATPLGGMIHLAWVGSTDPDVKGYQIYRSTDGTNFSLITGTNLVIESKYCDTGLTNGTRYYYRVRSVDDTLQQ